MQTGHHLLSGIRKPALRTLVVEAAHLAVKEVAYRYTTISATIGHPEQAANFLPVRRLKTKTASPQTCVKMHVGTLAGVAAILSIDLKLQTLCTEKSLLQRYCDWE